MAPVSGTENLEIDKSRSDVCSVVTVKRIQMRQKITHSVVDGRLIAGTFLFWLDGEQSSFNRTNVKHWFCRLSEGNKSRLASSPSKLPPLENTVGLLPTNIHQPMFLVFSGLLVYLSAEEHTFPLDYLLLTSLSTISGPWASCTYQWSSYRSPRVLSDPR